MARPGKKNDKTLDAQRKGGTSLAKKILTKIGCEGPARFKMRSQTTKYGGFWICGGERCTVRAWRFYNDRMSGAKMIDPRIKRNGKKCGEVV